MHFNLKKYSIVLPFLLFMISGCSHFKHGPVALADQTTEQAAKQFVVQNEKSSIYVIFTGGYSSSYRNFPVTINGVHHGFLSDGTFMHIAVVPGNYSILSSSPENQQLLEIEIKAGRNYFIEMKSEIAWKDLQVKLQEIGQKEGEKAVLNANLVLMPKYLRSSSH
jgi:hypothetical protein